MMWIIYFAALADNITVLFATFGVLIFIGGLIITAHQHEYTDENLAKKTLKKTVITCAVIGILITIIPSTKTVYMMLGADLAVNLSHTPEANKVRTLVNAGLDKAIASLDDSSEEAVQNKQDN